MMTKTIKVRIGSQGQYYPAHPQATRKDDDMLLTIVNAPDDMYAGALCERLKFLTVWPYPETIDWATVKDAPRGAIIRCAEQ
jgi:hypothetical protein